MNNTNTEIDIEKIIRNSFVFYKNNKWIITTFFVFAFVFSLYNLKRNPQKYRTFYKKNILVKSSFVSNEIIHNLLKPIELSSNSGNIKSFAPQLGISYSLLKDFRSLNIELESDHENSILKLSLEGYTIQCIDSFINGLAFYLNSVDYLEFKHSFEMKQRAQLLKVVNGQIEKLEKTKDLSTISLHEESNSNRKNDYLQNVELYEKKLKLEKELLDKPIDFIKVQTPYIAINNLKAGIIYVIGISFLGILIGVLLSYVYRRFV
jgi:hypothetical protein